MLELRHVLLMPCGARSDSPGYLGLCAYQINRLVGEGQACQRAAPKGAAVSEPSKSTSSLPKTSAKICIQRRLRAPPPTTASGREAALGRRASTSAKDRATPSRTA